MKNTPRKPQPPKKPCGEHPPQRVSKGKTWLVKTAMAFLLLCLVAPLSLLVNFSDEGEGTLSHYGWISFSARVAMAAQAGGVNGAGDPINQTPALEAIKAGLPVIAISYKDGISVEIQGGISLSFTKKQVDQFAKNRTIAELEQVIRDAAQDYFEIWVELSVIDSEDPVRQDPPVLRSYERIERQQGRDWLVITFGYFDIHITDLAMNEGDFTTRLSGNPIIGEWW